MLPLCAIDNAPIDVDWLLQCYVVKVAGGGETGGGKGVEKQKKTCEIVYVITMK